MNTLRRLPLWARAGLLLANLAASLIVLLANWVASYPNLIASWAQGSVLVTLGAPLLAWLDQRLTQHADAMKAHVDRALAAQPPDGGEAP